MPATETPARITGSGCWACAAGAMNRKARAARRRRRMGREGSRGPPRRLPDRLRRGGGSGARGVRPDRCTLLRGPQQQRAQRGADEGDGRGQYEDVVEAGGERLLAEAGQLRVARAARAAERDEV